MLLGAATVAAVAASLFLLPDPASYVAAFASSIVGGLLAYHLDPRFSKGGSVLVRGPRDRREVALTFDDGPNGDTTRRLLDVLRAKGVRATFFLVGAHAAREPEIARRIRAEGHAVGNHTQRHRKLTFLGRSAVEREVREAHEAIAAATGVPPRLFRAPHGWLSPFLPRTLRRLGYRATCAWTRGVWDSEPGADPRRLAARATRRARAGEVILLHDGDGRRPGADRQATLAATPAIIDRYRARGFRFVTLEEWAPA